MSILSLPEPARAMVDAGTLACSTAYAISREPDGTRRAELLSKATQGTLRRDDAAKQVSQKPRTKPRMRCSFRVGSADVSILTDDEIDITECLVVLQQLTRECRRAVKLGLNVKTLECVLADKAENET